MSRDHPAAVDHPETVLAQLAGFGSAANVRAMSSMSSRRARS
jgi:hypothetical protein